MTAIAVGLSADPDARPDFIAATTGEGWFDAFEAWLKMHGWLSRSQ